MATLSEFLQVPFDLFVLILLLPAIILDTLTWVVRGVCCFVAMLVYGSQGGDFLSTVKFFVVSQLPELAKSKLPKRLTEAVASVKS
jgi:hypothetical protein